MKHLLKARYGIAANAIVRMENGVGGEVYAVETDQGAYIFKHIADNGMNTPQNEPHLVETLAANGIPVAAFVPALDGQVVWTDDAGETYHLQRRVPGCTFAAHTAPDWLLAESARLLGRIHTVLAPLPSLPIGIGEQFFRVMTPQRAEASYNQTMQQARQAGDEPVLQDLAYRVHLLPLLREMAVDIQQYTRGNTHGDYGIHQIICDDGRIQAVIDWTSACVHPLCWEVIRSYSYADPACRDGVIVEERLQRYLEAYLRERPLSDYDIRMMPYLYMYQLGVCDYYSQYYASANSNSGLFLFQARFSTRLLRWFERHVEHLSQHLTKSV